VSDNNQLSGEQRMAAAVKSMKTDIDVLYTQLRKGTYASPDTFANNWAHLIRMVEEMKPLLTKPDVKEALLRSDVLLVADLLAITYSVEIIENFLVCLENQAREGRCQTQQTPT